MHKLVRRQQAYTLIEIVVTLMIFAIVSLIVAMVLRNILNVRDSIQKQSSAIAKVQKAVTIITRDIEQTISRGIINEQGQIELAVVGEENGGNQSTLTFTRAGYVNVDAIEPRSTLQRIRYRLEKNSLLREAWPTLDRTQATPPEQFELMHDVTRLNWRYFDNEGKSYTLWPPTGNLNLPPRAIELTLELQDWGEIKRLITLPGYNLYG